MASAISESPKKKTVNTKTTSPIVQARSIPAHTKILLAVAAGGHCQFPGCPKYLFEHPITMKGGNFSEHAHIVAFREDGPRGRQPSRPMDINSIANLMLICAEDHHEVDENPLEYPKSLLLRWKRQHEERIRRVTSLADSMKTTVVVFKARIGGQLVEIPRDEIFDAVLPRWPTASGGHMIDLTGIDDTSDGFMSVAQQQIKTGVAELLARRIDGAPVEHVSLFALGPIPMLAALGGELSNKIQVDFFQRHREVGKLWTWRTQGTAARFQVRKLRKGRSPSSVALVMDLSGAIPLGDLPSEIDHNYTVYRLSLVDQAPNLGFLRRREDLEAFRKTYRDFVAGLRKKHPRLRELHLFPAVPAPIAVCCAHDLLPKAHPALLVYDYDKSRGGFVFRVRVNGNEAR